MAYRGLWVLAITAVVAAAAAVAGQAANSWLGRQQAVKQAIAETGGDPARAAAAIGRLGCGACHEIPGMPGAVGQVGPPLGHMRARTYIAGVLPNTPDNLVLWIRWPQGVLPKSAMPNMGASEAESRDIAAYLLSLR